MRIIPKRDRQPKYVRSKINTYIINYKTYHFSKLEFFLYFLLFFIAGGIVGLIFYMNLFMVGGEPTIATHISNITVFVLFGLISLRVFMPMQKKNLYEKRNTKFNLQFREMLSSLSTSFSGGGNVYSAFNNAYEEMLSQFGENSMIANEAFVIVRGMENGYTIIELLQDFSERSVSEDIKNFVNVFETCFRTGGDMKAVIRNTYDLIGDKLAITEEIKTKLTSNKMQLNVMSIMPIVIIAFLRFSSSQFSETFASPSGVIMMTVAICIFIGAYIYGKKIVEIKG